MVLVYETRTYHSDKQKERDDESRVVGTQKRVAASNPRAVTASVSFIPFNQNEFQEKVFSFFSFLFRLTDFRKIVN